MTASINTMSYIDQSHKELTHSLFDQDLDIRSLSVITSDRIYVKGGWLEAGILGASHYIKVGRDNYVMTEIFACTPAINLLGKSIHNAGYHDLINNYNQIIGHIDYTFSYNQLSFSEYQSSSKDAENTTARCISLAYTFPALSKGLHAKTLVDVFYNEDESTFSTHTIHEYPHEDVAIINTSSFVWIK